MKLDQNCPSCHNEPATIDSTYGVLPGKVCQSRQMQMKANQLPEFITLTKKERIESQRDEFMGDMEMPHGAGGKPNRKFAEINPDLVKSYYSKAEIKEMDL